MNPGHEVRYFIDERMADELRIVLGKKLSRETRNVIIDMLEDNISPEIMKGIDKVFGKIRVKPILSFSDLTPSELDLLLGIFGIGMLDYCFGHICCDEEISDMINRVLDLGLKGLDADARLGGLLRPFDALILTDIEIMTRGATAFDYVYDNIYTVVDEAYDQIFCSVERVGENSWLFRISYSDIIDP